MEKMKKMPREIKSKLRSLANATYKVQQLEQEIENMFQEYDIDTGVFRAMGEEEVETEALAMISNAEGGTTDCIKEIEKVFLHYVNK